MTSALHQITMSFSAEEDRLLLRMSTADKTEFRFWLTRRFVRVLWGALIKTIENEPDIRRAIQPAARKAVMAMEHQQAVGASDFSRAHEQGHRNVTGESGPLLVTGGSVRPGKGKNGLTVLNLQTRGGPDVKLGLNKNLLHALCRLLIDTTTHAGWDLGLTVGDAGSLAPGDRTRVH
ncbi:MAG TPA: hypothetical protein VF987_06035 [Rhodospirillales bacterium]